jgi:hypothetical protein
MKRIQAKIDEKPRVQFKILFKSWTLIKYYFRFTLSLDSWVVTVENQDDIVTE